MTTLSRTASSTNFRLFARRLGLLGALACAAPALAQVHEGDIVLNTSTGTIRTGSLPSSGFVERRVFVSELGFIAPNFSSDPGFDNLPGSFAPSSRVGFVMLDALRKWNGSDFGIAQGIVPPERMLITRGPLTATTPLTPSVVQGFSLQVGTNGQWHRHYEYTLQSPASDGIYLLSLSLFSSASGGPSESLPFYVLFNQNAAPSDVQAAQSWVQSTLLTPPASCDSIDFNNDGLFPDDTDLVDFLSVLAGSSCAPCNDIDFNNDGLFPDDSDLVAFLRVLAGGDCAD
jgi:hypothetical protein